MKKIFSIIYISILLISSLGIITAAGDDGQNEQVDPLPLTIELKAARFDPLLNSPDIPGDMAFSEANNYYLVQFKGPIVQKWIDDIIGSNAKILGYIPEYTYLLFMDDGARNIIEKLPFIRWIGIYHPAYKIDSELLSKQGPVEVNVMVFDIGAGSENYLNVRNKIIETGGAVLRDEPEANTLVAELDANFLKTMTFIPEVEWIDEYSEPEPLMDNIRVFTGAESPLHEFGFNGSGIVGEVKDNGIDTGHIEFTESLIGTDGSFDEDASHGTSTFGIVFAKGANDRAQGMMPGGKGVFASWGVGRIQSVANLVNNWGGVFQSNSWHSGTLDGTYGSNTRQNDQAVFDYDISMLYATGNGGADESITQEAAAKNIIGVGATNHYNNQDRTDDKHNGNQGNKGPTADGRFKPDVVGPYDSIYTTTSNDRYTTGFGGTSGATPVVAGGVGLIYEMYRENHFNNNPSGQMPHASTVKALLIADAYQYEFSQADRFAQGWGLVDVGNVYNIGKNHLIDDEENALGTGESRTYSISPTTATPLKISLVWTDVPGTTSSSMHLINDLNLKVTAPDGKVYLGNGGLTDSKWSEPGGEFDGINNVENVFIEAPLEGEWVIDVIAENIPMDAEPNSREFDQPYALVVSGVTSYEHDLKVSAFEVPALVPAGEEVSVNATIVNIGVNKEENVKVSLQVDNITVNTTVIGSLGVGNSVKAYFSWIPPEENRYYLTVIAGPVSDEISTWDNRKTGILKSVFFSGSVLVDNGHGTSVDNDMYYYYLENLGPDKYLVHHTTQSITDNLLLDYDVLIITDPANAYTFDELESIRNFIAAGGSLLVIGEDSQNIYNSLTEFSGITWGNPYLIQYNGETSDFNPHEITENITTLYFDSPQLPLEVSEPAEELVYINGGPLENRVSVAAAGYGQGKLVAVADSDCLNDQFINTADNRVLGMNIIKWFINARPAAVIDSPANNSVFLVSDTIHFSANSSYDPDGDDITYQWNSDIDGVLGNLPFFSARLSAGTHNITLVVSDEADKTAEAGITINILSPPEVEILNPVEGALLNGILEVSGTAADPDGSTVAVEVGIDARGWQLADDKSSSKDWSEWVITLDSTELYDGGHSISARAVDSNGLYSAVVTVTVSLDNTAPAVLFGPLVGSITDTGAVIEWETDEPATSVVEYGTDRVLGQSAGNSSYTTLHKVALKDLVPDTLYYYSISSTDEVGNKPFSETENTFKTKRPPDFNPPSVKITSPSKNEILKGHVYLTADVTDDQGIGYVEFYIEDELVFSDDMPEYSWLWDTADDYYPDGEYTITITAVDINGNRAEDEITVVLDNEIIPPVIDSTSVTPSSVPDGEPTAVLFTIKIRDPENAIKSILIDLSSIGGSSSQSMFDDGTNGDEIAGDNIYSFETMVLPDVLQGKKSLEISMIYGDDATMDAVLVLYVTASDNEVEPDVAQNYLESQWLLWLIIISVISIVIAISAYLVALGRRQSSEDVIEVEPIEISEYYY